MYSQVICKICGKDFIDTRYLSAHLRFEEHVKSKDYYDMYFKKPNDGICIVCGKETKFHNIVKGYSKTCSKECSNSPLSDKGKLISNAKQSYSDNKKLEIRHKCETTCLEKYGAISNLATDITIKNSHSKEARQKAVNTHKIHMNDGTIVGQNIEQSWKTRKQNIDEFCIKNNCTPVKTLLEKYGQGWLSLDIPRMYMNKQNSAVSNVYLAMIEDYFIQNQYSNKSKAEQYIIDNLNYTGTITHNDRTIIRPKEIDIYLPDLKIGIEYNGTYWHSIEAGTDKYAHRNKSLTCRKLGIRLVHIYEFEDLDGQIKLLNDLINGNDRFDQNFTKNNLLDIIPDDVSIIYKDDHYTIYSA